VMEAATTEPEAVAAELVATEVAVAVAANEAEGVESVAAALVAVAAAVSTGSVVEKEMRRDREEYECGASGVSPGQGVVPGGTPRVCQ